MLPSSASTTRGEAKSRLNISAVTKKIGIALPLAVIVALLAIGALISPGFATPANIMALLSAASILAVTSAGQTIVIISGNQGLDLSVGPVMTLSALLASGIGASADANLPMAALAIVIACTIIGTVNFVGTFYVGVYPLIMTLGMGFVVSGGALVYIQARGSSVPAPLILAVGGGKIGGVPLLIIAAVVIFVLLAILMNATRFGRRLYLVGANSRAARLSGTPVARVYLAAYVLASLLAGAAGVFLFGYAGNVNLSIGDPYTLLSIAATVVGGTSLAGGKGSVVGSLLGAIIFIILTNMLVVLGLSQALRYVLTGLLLIGILAVTARESSV
jgi:ribose transport system permease protein